MSVPVPEYVPDFRPTHVVPRDGLSAWEAPDPGLPTTPLDGFLPVRLEERAGDWGRIQCANGWTAWVDARLLVSVPEDPPAAGRPLTRTADPRPLIARAEDAIGRYRRAAEELGAQRLDGEQFRLRTRGLRVGMVVDGESVWLYDAEHERWVYCDGVGLSTYVASSVPSISAAPSPSPSGSPTDAESLPAPVAAGFAGTDADAEPGSDAETSPGTDAEESGEDDAHERTRPVPVAHEPTQVVAQVDAQVPAGPPPTQVVKAPPAPAGEE
ncbi:MULTISPECIES: hypothetical protein [unclassified Streptomyces]|uniref:hypothetical protein n=1 Tax=unclassified Streptomyces TaxID=2593676 RepID=UPI0006F92942|nr:MULTISPECIES: hypothetical protein [unclassified Streptomyces]KQX49905.1 hypothetical protein ASD33_14745 [Streptomyces sp. Root1304]KRA80052.1 hypothetical protein ASE09_18165 [Streptomyces sp. Root66D1]